MAKIGRPKIEKVKEKTITIRVTEEEHKIINQYAKAHDTTITQIVKQGVDKIINQGWLHFDSIEKGLNNEN